MPSKDLATSGGDIETDWIAGTVMANHSGIEGHDKDFYVLCAWAHVRTTVRAVLRRYRPEPDKKTDRQLILSGYERLQVAYHVERNGSSHLARIERMTPMEIRHKVNEYRSQAEGLHLHADELERYDTQRAA